MSKAVQRSAWRGTPWIAATMLLLCAPALVAAPAAPAASQPSVKPAAPIDLNSASRAQLKSLPGIGDAEAERIVARRPYRSKADLVEHGVLPAGVYLAIKGRIIATQPAKPSGKPT